MHPQQLVPLRPHHELFSFLRFFLLHSIFVHKRTLPNGASFLCDSHRRRDVYIVHEQSPAINIQSKKPRELMFVFFGEREAAPV